MCGIGEQNTKNNTAISDTISWKGEWLLETLWKKKKPSKNEDDPPLGLHSSRRPWFDSWVRRICWRWDMLPTPVLLCFPGGSAGKEFTCHAGDLGLIPGLGRSPGEGTGYPLQDSGLENSRGYTVHGVAESDTTEWLHFHYRHNKSIQYFTIILKVELQFRFS